MLEIDLAQLGMGDSCALNSLDTIGEGVKRWASTLNLLVVKFSSPLIHFLVPGMTVPKFPYTASQFLSRYHLSWFFSPSFMVVTFLIQILETFLFLIYMVLALRSGFQWLCGFYSANYRAGLLSSWRLSNY